MSRLYANTEHITELLQPMWKAMGCYKISEKLMLGTRADFRSEVRGSNSAVSWV